MDEENDNAQTEEVIQSEEKEDEQNNGQDDAQVPMTFEEMLLRCEEQVDSSHDSKKIKVTTWDITVTPATQDIEPNVDHDKDSQRICRDRREHEEQRRRCRGMDMSMYQVDTQFQNHMVRHTDKEIKIQDRQDNNKEKVSIKQEIDKQPNRGKTNVMMMKMIESLQQNQRKMSPQMTKIVKTMRNRIIRRIMSKR